MTVEQQIARLERRSRCLTGAVLGLAAALGVVTLAGAVEKRDDVLRAREIEVVDEAGRVRVHIGPEDAGYGLVVNDEQGLFRATLTDAPAGAAIQLRKAAGQIKLLVTDGSVGPVGNTAGLSIRDAEGRPRFVGAVDEGKPDLRVLDEDGKTVFSATEGGRN